MRIQNTIRNSIWAFVCQFVGIALGFINRIIIIKLLGIEYLGISSLFRDILYLLSIAEMGIGYAIMYEMYKPMHFGDFENLNILVNYYKSIYAKIGALVFCIGLSIIPFLFIIIPDARSIQNVRLIYIIFVLNSSMTYLTINRRSLINVAQKNYIEQIVTSIIVVIQTLLQLICLLITRNYLLYVVCSFICTILNMSIIIIISNKLFPFIKIKPAKTLDKQVGYRIKENIKALFIVNTSGVIFSATDSLIISNTQGLSELGLYANYTMIVNYLNMVIRLGINAVMASIGDLNAEKEPHEVYIYYKRILFLIYLITSVFCILFFNLCNDFIQALFGLDFILSNNVVFLLMINMYIINFRLPALIFRNAMGIFKYDRYKGIPEIVIKLSLSILLANQYGVLGVLIGTTISILLVSFWIEPFMLYKYGFGISFINFTKYCLIYTFVSAISFSLCAIITSLIKVSGIIGFIIKGSICFPLSIIIILCFFFKMDECKYYFDLSKNIINTRKLSSF